MVKIDDQFTKEKKILLDKKNFPVVLWSVALLKLATLGFIMTYENLGFPF